MKPRVVAVDRIVLDGVALPPGGAEGFRAALETRLAAELRGWDGPVAGRAPDAPLGVSASASDPEALAREVGARVARLLKEGR